MDLEQNFIGSNGIASLALNLNNLEELVVYSQHGITDPYTIKRCNEEGIMQIAKNHNNITRLQIGI